MVNACRFSEQDAKTKRFSTEKNLKMSTYTRRLRAFKGQPNSEAQEKRSLSALERFSICRSCPTIARSTKK